MLVSQFSNLVYSGDLARTNLYEIHFGNIKQQESFYTKLGRTIPNELLKYQAKSVSMPNKALGTVDVKRFGATFKMANDVIAGEVSVTFNLSDDYRERHFFDGWLSAIGGRDVWTEYKELQSDEFGMNEDTVYTMLYYDDYVTTMYIETMKRSGKQSQVIELIEAYPTNVGSVDLSYGDGAIAQFTVTFAIRDWKVMKEKNSSDEELELKYANKTDSTMVLASEEELDNQDYRWGMGLNEIKTEKVTDTWTLGADFKPQKTGTKVETGSYNLGDTFGAAMDKSSAPFTTTDILDSNDEYYGIHGKDMNIDESNLLLQSNKDDAWKKKMDDAEIAEYRNGMDELDAASDNQEMMETQTEETEHFLKYGHNENLDDVAIYANARPIGYIADAIDDYIITPLGEGVKILAEARNDLAAEVDKYMTGNPTRSEQAEQAYTKAVDDQERMEFIADANAEWAHIDKVAAFNKSGDMEGLDEYLYAGGFDEPLADEAANTGLDGPAKFDLDNVYTKSTMSETIHSDFKNDKVSGHEEDVDWNMDIGNGMGGIMMDDFSSSWGSDATTKDFNSEGPVFIREPINEAVDHSHFKYNDDALDTQLEQSKNFEIGQAEIAAELENKSGIGDAIVGFEPQHIDGRATASDKPYGVDTDSQGTGEHPHGTIFFDDDINKYTKSTFGGGFYPSGTTKVSQNGVDKISAREPAYSFLHKDNMIEPSTMAKSGGVDYTDYGSYITTTYIPYPNEQNYLKNKQRYNDKLHEEEKSAVIEEYFDNKSVGPNDKKTFMGMQHFENENDARDFLDYSNKNNPLPDGGVYYIEAEDKQIIKAFFSEPTDTAIGNSKDDLDFKFGFGTSGEMFYEDRETGELFKNQPAPPPPPTGQD